MRKDLIDKAWRQEHDKLLQMVDMACRQGKPLCAQELVKQSQKVDRILNQLAREGNGHGGMNGIFERTQ